MDQQIVIPVGGYIIVSGTGLTVAGEGGDHVREYYFKVPFFAGRPDITVTIYSDDNDGVLGLPMPAPANFNPGIRLTPWAVQYLPEGIPGGDWIAVSASTVNDDPTSSRFFCSYVIVGVPAKVDPA